MAKIEAIKDMVIGMQVLKPEATVKSDNPKPQMYVNNDDIDKKEIAQIKEALKALKVGVDYGKIPGVDGEVLFKKGARKILKKLKYRYTESMIEKTIDIPNGFIGYTMKVCVISGSGNIVAESHGSANSLESKFVKKGLSSDHLLTAVASKRALIDCVKSIITECF